MSDDESKELPDLEELPELPDLPDFEEVSAEAVPAEAGEAPKDAPAETASPDAAPPGADGGKPPLRVLDKAPFLLRRAAVVVVAGCALPWMGHQGGWMTSIVAKVLIVAGLWIWYQQVMHNWGPKLNGFFGKLADTGLIPKKKAKKDEKEARPGARKRIADTKGAMTLEHPFPTPLHLFSLILALVSVIAFPLMDGNLIEGTDIGRAIAELGMLAWAAGTFVHIVSYERWGRFSPIFPMMFLGMVFAGLMSFIKGLGAFSESALLGVSMVLGGGAVTFGGGLAAYTIIEALMQAKREGDLKRKAASDARKAMRESRKSAGKDEATPGS
jgi:hypothetical protein